MVGSKGPGIVIQERDLRLLRELEIMRVVDREQAKLACGFRSTTRANARLLALTRNGFLRRFFLGTTGGGQKALYTLLLRGAQLVGASHRGLQRRRDETAITGAFIQHQLIVNEIYCALKFKTIPVPDVTFQRWVSFDAPLGAGLLPDGYVELGSSVGLATAFLEVDLGTERTAIWEQKVRKYLTLALSGEYERRFHEQRFRVLVVANSERRMHSLRRVVSSITDKIFWLSTLGLFRREGFFAPIWFRPTAIDPVPLISQTL